jgi:hypothetical protein
VLTAVIYLAWRLTADKAAPGPREVTS